MGYRIRYMGEADRKWLESVIEKAVKNHYKPANA